MLYTEEAVRAGLRVRDGRRVFYLPEGSRLTPAARDWLRQEGVTVVPHAETPPAAYRTPDGASFAEKPEHMTHLRGNILVPKTHPRIAFRGGIDTLEAELLLCAQAADGPLRRSRASPMTPSWPTISRALHSVGKNKAAGFHQRLCQFSYSPNRLSSQLQADCSTAEAVSLTDSTAFCTFSPSLEPEGSCTVQ